MNAPCDTAMRLATPAAGASARRRSGRAWRARSMRMRAAAANSSVASVTRMGMSHDVMTCGVDDVSAKAFPGQRWPHVAPGNGTG